MTKKKQQLYCEHVPAKYVETAYDDDEGSGYGFCYKECRKCGRTIRMVLSLFEDIVLAVGQDHGFMMKICDIIDELAETKYGYVYKDDDKEGYCVTYHAPKAMNVEV